MSIVEKEMKAFRDRLDWVDSILGKIAERQRETDKRFGGFIQSAAESLEDKLKSKK